MSQRVLLDGVFFAERGESLEELTQVCGVSVDRLSYDSEHFKARLACAVRSRRDGLIRETDFYFFPDYPSIPEGMAEYRQALRDITEQPGFPHDVTWPELAAVDAPE